jgi:glycosyltransferase involved in cell wall biosynthesis
VFAEVLLGAVGLIGIVREVPLQLLTPPLVAALLDSALEIAHPPFVGIGHNTSSRRPLVSKVTSVCPAPHHPNAVARILIATDAWHPQVSGVVRTLETTVRVLRQWGHAVEVVEPSPYWSIPFPFYPDVPMSLPRAGRIGSRILRFRPDHVHIATEGGIGLMVRRFCRRQGWQFTTSYHTRFPEYLHRLTHLPPGITYRFLRWFHSGSAAVFIATESLERELVARRFHQPFRRWSRGVDHEIFHPRPKAETGYKRPFLLHVGRISYEKGIEEFLRLNLPGTKFVVGDGPARKRLERDYPRAVFLGYRGGNELAEIYANADLFVFPSRTDTFGLVVIEALASGLPVAAHRVTGPGDIITSERLGALDEDLGRAVERALATGDPAACAAEGRRYTWEDATRQFLANLVPVR